jgi:hypothetical protein
MKRHLYALLSLLLLVAETAGLRAAPVVLPSGAALPEVNFERHVAPLLGRLGCNSGACHGSFQGKGGLRLSLFGHSPEKDYAALTHDSMGRRINLADPDQSLLLLKPTAQIPHEGGQRFAKNSWQYQLLREWIAHGAPWSPGDSRVKRLEVLPPEHHFTGPGETIQLRVLVDFADGTRADVTPFCEFRIKDDSIAAATTAGEIRGLRPGDTVVIVGYRGQLLTSRALVPVPVEKDFIYPSVPLENYIDREVFTKLKQLRIVPSELCDDATFLRRVTLDTIGTLPAPEEVHAFLADPSFGKRRKVIDGLLTHPLHAALWATKFCDITGNNLDVMEDPVEMGPKRAKMWHDWFRRRIAQNAPYDQIVRGVLTATSRAGLPMQDWVQGEIALSRQMQKGYQTNYAERTGLDLFWRRLAADDFFPLEQMAERTATAFLGVRLECAQCHKHPYDRWTQADYRAFANIFAQVKFDTSPEVTAIMARLLEERRKLPAGKAGPPLPHLREVYVSNQPLRRLPDPATNGTLAPKALGGPELDFEGDARVNLCDWLVQPENPFFARSFVNRVWAHYFGIGLVEPVDNFSVANPPSNEALLDALARDFAEHDYDIRRLEWTILNSRTYQLSALPNSTNAGDRGNFSHVYVRPLMAEVVVDVVNAALGVQESFGEGVPQGARAIEIAPNRVADAHLAHIFRIFGRPARTAACDCERAQEPAVPQTLFLMSDPALLDKIGKGRLPKLLSQNKSDEEIVKELFLATLSRFPNDQEKKAALQHVQSSKDKRKAFVDVTWGLLNTREFILNH